MSDETLFYVCGITLAVSAVVISFVGLKMKRFPSRAAFSVAILWFALLVGGATTYSVLHAKHEEEHHAAEFEHAGEEFEKEESSGPFEEAEEEAGGGGGDEAATEAEPGSEGAGTAVETIQLAADPAAIAYDKTELIAKSGEVTIDLDNPAPIAHDVAIEKDGEEIDRSETLAEGRTSVSADLEPGTYTFFCSVPGHREAGMEGTLTVE
jgi:plastocyanin